MGLRGDPALLPVQWHRTPTTQETDGFQVKRPGDLSVRCTLLLMLDYQVRACLPPAPDGTRGPRPPMPFLLGKDKGPHSPPHPPFPDACSQGACHHMPHPHAVPRCLAPSPFHSLPHFHGHLFPASPVQTGSPPGPAAGAAHTEPLGHRPGPVAVCEDEQAAGLTRQGIHQRGQVLPAGSLNAGAWARAVASRGRASTKAPHIPPGFPGFRNGTHSGSVRVLAPGARARPYRGRAA